MGLVEESDMFERGEKKKHKKQKEKDDGLLNLEAEGMRECNGEQSNECDRKKKKKEKREKDNGVLNSEAKGTREDNGEKSNEGDRKKKKKEKREKDNGVFNSEAEGTREDSGGKSNEGDRKKKKKDKREKDNGLLNSEAEGTRECNGEKSNESDRKKMKKEKREKKIGGSYLHDGDVSGEELSQKKDHLMKEHEKKHIKEQDGDSEVVSAKEEKKRKKEKGNKVMDDMGNYDKDEETHTGKSKVERQVNNESLDLSKVEKKTDHEIDLEDTKGKKKEKKWKRKEVVTDSLSKTQNYKQAGKDMETEPESIEEQDISVDTEAGEDYTTHKEKKKSKKQKDKRDGNVDSPLANNSGENSTKDEKRKKITGDEEERNILADIEGGSKIDTGSSKKRKKDNKCKNFTEDHSREILETPVDREKNKSKKKKDTIDSNVYSLLPSNSGENSTKDKKRKNITGDEEVRSTLAHVKTSCNIDTGSSKKRKKKDKCKTDTYDNSPEILETPVDRGNTAVGDVGDGFSGGRHGSVGKKKRDRDNEVVHAEKEKVDKKMRKKAKSIENVNVTSNNEETAGCPGNIETKKPTKRVKFSSTVEVFPLSDAGDVRKENQEGDLVRGKRFSKDEDEIVKNAVLNYIEEHGLGDEGLHKVLHCKSYPETKHCWKEISAAIPWRPAAGIYSRAHVLFERAEKREWSAEDLELVKMFHEKHGPDWRALGDEMKRSRIHVKDAWRRRVSLPDRRTGPWSQEEYQKFFDLVNLDLRMKVFEEKRSQYGMLRDNIAWDAISKKLSTRSNDDCCRKWYGQLESPLVREGKWASSDDFRLLRELDAMDFTSVEEVDWDNLLDHRPGDICRKRWYQMVNHLGDHGNKAFADQLEVLMKRYCPDVLETREVLESKTPID